jgi:uncharacterized protein YndB with AHSA1/START domain
MTDNSVITECDLPDAPEKVWKALTVPELLAAWLPDAVDCEILAAEPHRLLRYRWPGDEQDRDAAGHKLDSVVTFELTGTDTGGTHLRVVHRAFASTARIIPFRGARSEPVACAAAGGARMMLRRAA